MFHFWEAGKRVEAIFYAKSGRVAKEAHAATLTPGTRRASSYAITDSRCRQGGPDSSSPTAPEGRSPPGRFNESHGRYEVARKMPERNQRCLVPRHDTEGVWRPAILRASSGYRFG